jgi:hypothetical protein
MTEAVLHVHDDQRVPLDAHHPAPSVDFITITDVPRIE